MARFGLEQHLENSSGHGPVTKGTGSENFAEVQLATLRKSKR